MIGRLTADAGQQKATADAADAHARSINEASAERADAELRLHNNLVTVRPAALTAIENAKVAVAKAVRAQGGRGSRARARAAQRNRQCGAIGCRRRRGCGDKQRGTRGGQFLRGWCEREVRRRELRGWERAVRRFIAAAGELGSSLRGDRATTNRCAYCTATQHHRTRQLHPGAALGRENPIAASLIVAVTSLVAPALADETIYVVPT
jgi:hypothetical protein